MAATTSQPILFSVRCTRDPDNPGTVKVFTTWRGVDLTTGAPVEIHVTNLQADTDLMTKDTWESIYSDLYDEWTAVTLDTTHAAAPFTSYPVSL